MPKMLSNKNRKHIHSCQKTGYVMKDYFVSFVISHISLICLMEHSHMNMTNVFIVKYSKRNSELELTVYEIFYMIKKIVEEDCDT